MDYPLGNFLMTGFLNGSEFKDEFHRLLGRLVHAISQLDFNAGLELNFWVREDDPALQKLLRRRTAKLDDRLKALEEIMIRACTSSGDEALQAFRDWFKRAHRAKALRNDYAHGRWGVPGAYRQAPSGRQCDAEPLLSFVPLNWNMSPGRSDNMVTMTLSQFEVQVSEVESLGSEYHALTKKHAGLACPGQRLGGK